MLIGKVKSKLFVALIASALILSLTGSSATAQTKPIQVSGTVSDSEKVPLIGVGVMVKGTTIGTSTDLDGHF